MADKQLSALTAATALSIGDLFYAEQGANSRKATAQQIVDIAKGQIKPAFSEPVAADFSISRSAGGSPSIIDPPGQNGILMTTTRGASRQNSFYLKAAGVSAPFTVEAGIYCQYEVDDPFWWCGIAVGDTSANQHAYVALSSGATGVTGPVVTNGYLSSLTAVETDSTGIAGVTKHSYGLIKLVVSATEIKGYWSPDGDGRHWHLLSTITIAGKFTNGVTTVGFYEGYVASTGTNKMWCPHFSVY